MNRRYVLDCTECPFRTEVEGTFAEVSETIESHREAEDASPTEHFVNVHRVDDGD